MNQDRTEQGLPEGPVIAAGQGRGPARWPAVLIAGLLGSGTMAVLWGAETVLLAVKAVSHPYAPRPWAFPGVPGTTLLAYLLIGVLLGGLYHGLFWRKPLSQGRAGGCWPAVAWATVGIHLFFRLPLFPRLMPDLAAGTLVDDFTIIALWYVLTGELARLALRTCGRPGRFDSGRGDANQEALVFWLHGFLLSGPALAGALDLEPESLPGIGIAAGAVLASAATALWGRRRRIVRPESRPWLLPAGCLAALVLAVLSAGARLTFVDVVSTSGTDGSAAGPPVVHITIDTLRAGSSFPSPQWLEKNGAIHFSHCTCQATWTLPSTASLLTGRLPGELGGVTRVYRLPREAETIAERFAAAGYHTAAFSDNRLISPAGGFAQGFAEFHLENGDDLLLCYPFFGTSGVLRQVVVRRLRLLYQGVDRLMPRVESWLDRNHRRPFYLYLHLMDPHYPYYESDVGETPHPVSVTWNVLENQRRQNFLVRVRPGGRQELLGRYAAEVRRTSRAIGRLVQCLQRLGLWERCLLVIGSDHGEEFFEHGSWGHGHSVREEVSRVPLIIKPPRHQAARGRTLSAPVQNLDLTPTILEGAGIEFRGLPGTSLWPLVHGAESPPGFGNRQLTTVAYFPYPRPRHCFAVRSGRLKCIMRRIDGREETEWFDLQADPAESRPLTTNPGGEEARLLTEALQRLAGETTGFEPDDPLLDRKALEAMGYVR